MRMNIYRVSQLIAYIDTEPKDAWRFARQYVREMAHSEGCTEAEVIDQTANRPFVMRGPYQATPQIARPSLRSGRGVP